MNTTLKRTVGPGLAALVLSSILGAQASQAPIRIVTTTRTLADIAAQVGGERVEVESIMRGPENVHNVVAKPSFMTRLRMADLFIHGGLDAEPWVPNLIKGARKAELLPGDEGNVDASRSIALKEVPARGELSRALGDIHVYGNTHYPLDPLNGIIIARTIADALGRTDPAHRAGFDANVEAFATRVRELTERLEAKMEPYRGTPVVTYHRSWPYFLDRFGLRRIAEIEPKPGISPGPGHLERCVETMTAQGAKIVIAETFNPRKAAESVARRAGGRAVVLAHEVGALPEADSYEKLFETDVALLLAAFADAGVRPLRDAGSGDDAATPGSARGGEGER